MPERDVGMQSTMASGEQIELATIMMLHANIVFAQGDHPAAFRELEQAMAIYDHRNDLRNWAPIAYNTADGYRVDGQCDRATPTLERIVKLADAGEIERSMSAAARGDLGVCQRMEGKLDEARATLTGAVADLDTFGMPGFAAQTRLELAEVEWLSGHKDKARALAQQVKDAVTDDSETSKGLRQQADDWYLKPKPGIRR
jgi:hypothetical protein